LVFSSVKYCIRAAGCLENLTTQIMPQGELFPLKFRIEYNKITSFSTMYPRATACFSPDKSGKEFFLFPSLRYVLHFTQNFYSAISWSCDALWTSPRNAINCAAPVTSLIHTLASV